MPFAPNIVPGLAVDGEDKGFPVNAETQELAFQRAVNALEANGIQLCQFLCIHYSTPLVRYLSF